VCGDGKTESPLAHFKHLYHIVYQDTSPGCCRCFGDDLPEWMRHYDLDVIRRRMAAIIQIKRPDVIILANHVACGAYGAAGHDQDLHRRHLMAGVRRLSVWFPDYSEPGKILPFLLDERYRLRPAGEVAQELHDRQRQLLGVV
jgi:hypothetical protein